MADIPLGISFEEDNNGFVLRRKEANGDVTAIHMAEDELFGLKATIELWSDRILQASQARSGSVHTVVAHPIGRVGLMTDALKANVIAAMEAPSGQRMYLSFPPAVADYILETLPNVLRELETGDPPKQ